MWKLSKCLRHLRVKFRDACNLNHQTSATNEELNPNHQFQSSGCCLDRFQFRQREDDFKNESSNKNTSRQDSGHLNVDNYCSFFGAVGWGTVLLVGLQYASRKWNTKDFFDKHDVNLRDVFYRLSPAIATWRLNPIKLHVLPTSTSPLTSNDVPLNFDFDAESKLKDEKLNNGVDHRDEFKVLNEKFEDVEVEVEKPKFNSEVSAKLSSVADDCVSLIQNNVGIGLIREQKNNDALFYFEAASELGNSKACFNAGICYERGLGTEKNVLKAKEFYQKAAEKGHATALYNLGVINLRENDVINGMKLLEIAANLGIHDALKLMAVHYLESDEMEKAIPFLTAAVEKNDVECQYYLGLCYENGWGLEEDLSKAVEFYAKAAENGHLDAMYNFAMFNELGLGGLNKQEEVAFELYSKAARAGHVESREKLSKIGLEKQSSLANENLTPLHESELHNSSSLPNITSLNRESLSLTKCLSDNILRMHKKINFHFNNEMQSIENRRQVCETNEEFVTQLWMQQNVVF